MKGNSVKNILARARGFYKNNSLDSGLLEDYCSVKSLRIAFCGAFNAGKSSLINALLERKVLPTRAISSSSVGIEISYSQQEYCVVEHVQGADKKIAINELRNYAMLQNDTYDKNISYIRMYLNSPLLAKGLVFIDTPGVEDDDFLTALTSKAIQHADFLFIVVSAQRMFSAHEKRLIYDFYDQLSGNISFVVNKMDLLDNDDDILAVRSMATRYLRNFTNQHLEDNIAYTVADGGSYYEIAGLQKIINAVNAAGVRQTIQNISRLSHTENMLADLEYKHVEAMELLNEKITALETSYKSNIAKAERIKRDRVVGISRRLCSLRENLDKFVKSFSNMCQQMAQANDLLSHGHYIAANLFCVLEVAKSEWGNRFMQKIHNMLKEYEATIDHTFSNEIHSSKQDFIDSEMVFVSKFNRFLDRHQSADKYHRAFVYLMAKESNYLKNEILELIECIEMQLDSILDYDSSSFLDSGNGDLIRKFDSYSQSLRQIRKLREEIRETITK